MKDKIFIENQPLLTKLLNLVSNANNISGGYIIVGDSKEDLEKYSILLCKALICPNKYTSDCQKCNICKRIDSNNYSELEIINPENSIIKKEQVISLKNRFSKEIVEGKRGVYIINDVEYLNGAAANAILKFLEEPDSNVVAIFTTTNIDRVLPTILSRSQVVKINNIRKKYSIEFVKEVTKLDEDEIYSVITFLKKIELDKSDAMTLLKSDFINIFNDKNKLKSALTVMILFYKDILNYNIKQKCLYFEENELISISKMNNNEVLSKKISFLLENLSKIEYNVNVLLFMSNLLIGIGDITK